LEEKLRHEMESKDEESLSEETLALIEAKTPSNTDEWTDLTSYDGVNKQLSNKQFEKLMDHGQASQDKYTDSSDSNDGEVATITEWTDSQNENMEFANKNITSANVRYELSKAWAAEYSDKLEDYLSEGSVANPDFMRELLPDSDGLNQIAAEVE
jgi:hypothetical protein